MASFIVTSSTCFHLDAEDMLKFGSSHRWHLGEEDREIFPFYGNSACIPQYRRRAHVHFGFFLFLRQIRWLLSDRGCWHVGF